MTSASSRSLRGVRVLVTGGAGVIGRELLIRLREERAEILSVDRLPLPPGDWSGVRHLQLDLASDSLGALADFRPQIVFHLAASFERSEESPEFWATNWHDNTLASHRLLELVRDLPEVEALVFASSYLIYAPSLYLFPSVRADVVRLKETDLVAPRNICGAAKFYTERELDFVDHLHPSLRTVSARIYRVYGRGSRDVISRWLRAALAGERIEVFSPENRFDYIFAGDVAEGLVRMAKSPEASGVVNLGSGVARSVQEVVDLLGACLPEHPLNLTHLSTQPPFEHSCADLTRLRQATGWTPPTSLEQGTKAVAAFERGVA